jgi:hypothetical protein
MKKVLNWFLSVLGFFLLISLMVISLGERMNFINPNWESFANFIKNYGAILIVGLLVFVNIIGKSVIRIILTIIFLAVGAFYIFATAFPAQFVQIFGIA